ncbi:aroma-sacti cluster domain-containing protein [Streptomyces otsuchiensis]|uniref:aroma-sacti cluster domain-containing protein n=1 Tax=Streptomyces otsuchiensis TaxID=2681388 RepID=UPI001031BA3A|nr:aroma-sacti cluster domain-containing protein [Streptomyces otsuchiensis]
MTNAPEPDAGAEAERTLRALATAGFPVHTFTEDQCAVFAALAPEELALVLDIKGRLDAVEPEVTAHAAVAGAALF